MPMPVHANAGNVVEMRIVVLYATTNANGLSLGALIEGQTRKDKHMVQFGVVFSSHPLESGFGGGSYWRMEGVNSRPSLFPRSRQVHRAMAQ